MGPTALWCRLYRVLLQAYPRSFRHRYGAELEQAFLDDLSDPRHAGLLGRARFCTAVLTDLGRSAWRLRRRARADRRSSPDEGLRYGTPHRRSEMESIVQDLRQAIRLFVQRPGFTAVVVLSLALGIGGNALIFGLADNIVLNPFPYPDPDRLVAVGISLPRLGSGRSYVESLSPAEYLDVRRSRTLRHVMAFDLGNRNISGGDVPERVFTALVWGDPFETFGMRPAHGRGFRPEEAAKGAPPVAILSHRIWSSRFGSDPSLVGRTIRVNGAATTVVGVMPPGLLVIGTDLWLPMPVDPSVFPRNRRQFAILARLAPGATMAQANAELATIAADVERQYVGEFAEYRGWSLEATPWTKALLGEARPAAFLLLGAVGFVLLIACANIANLLLARAAARQREIAVRLALGAARWRIARQLIVESLALAVAGCAAGLALAVAGLRAARSLLPAQVIALGPEIGLDARVLGFSALLAIVAGLAVGVVPAIQATRTDPHDSMKSDARGATAGRGARRLRHAFVVAEIALALVLLAGGGLLIRSLLRLQQVDPGFDPAQVLTMRLTLPREKYEGAAVNQFFQELVDRVARMPGVRGASAASQFPPSGPFDTQFQIEGHDRPAQGALPQANITVATRDHFGTLGVPLRVGRGIAATDGPDTPLVAVVNETFARRFLAGANPVGRRISIGDPRPNRPWAEIVGMVGDVRNRGLRESVEPEIFIPMHQQTVWNQLFLLVRTQADAKAALAGVRREIMAMDPEQPVYAIQTMEEAFGNSVFQQRTAAILLGSFAALALVLAAVGIYGVVAHAVGARTQEIGIRMAVGAGRGHVVRLMLRQVLGLALAGLAIGLGLALALGRAASSLLFEIGPGDPLTLAAVSALLGAVAVLAAWTPIRRATRVDPVVALRYE
jgi:putative ABC transport system permease protein